jgi:hypothetical protein
MNNTKNFKNDEKKEDNWQIVSSKNQNKSKPFKSFTNKNSLPTNLDEQLPYFKDTYNTSNVDLIKSYVDKKEKCMVILRGCPGL